MSINIDNFYKIDYIPKVVIFFSGYVHTALTKRECTGEVIIEEVHTEKEWFNLQ